jgi:hypothetical protein
MSSVIRYGSARLLASKESNPGRLVSMGGVSNVSFGFSIDREKIKSMGYESPVHSMGKAPKANVEFSYSISDLENEELIGFPVTSQESVVLGRSIAYDLKPIDLAFVVTEGGEDFDTLSSTQRQEIKVCLVKNAYVSSYSISLSPKGIPVASVSFSGDDMLFKIFKNLSEYTEITLPVEEDIGSRLNFKVNDGSREPTSDIGGGQIISSIDSFEFDLGINYKDLLDFGQFRHKRKVNFPLHANLNISANVLGISEGEISGIFCEENLSKFIVSFSKKNCETGYLDEMSGMLFTNAMLVSQNYSMSAKSGSFLKTNLSFRVDLTRDCGVFFTQQVSSGEFLQQEVGSNILLMEVEDLDGNSPGLLSEGILDMLETLSSVTCGHHH